MTAALQLPEPLSAGSEVTVPIAARWWPDNAEGYARQLRLEGKWSETTAESSRRCLVAWPSRFENAGQPRPLHARDVTAEMLIAWREAPTGVGRYGGRLKLRQPSAFQALWVLRGFLAHHRNPIASVDALWRGRRGDATNRRWFDGAALDRMYALARTDRHRLVLAALGWAGLRRGELWRLLVEDANLGMDAPALVVTRKGGRRQELPIARAVANALRPFVLGRPGAARVYPCGRTTIYADVRELGAAIGLRVAPHDLRRTFGRILYYEHRVDINEIRSLYGHATTEMSLYYIGAVSDRMRAAVERFDRPRSPPVSPLLEVV